MCIVKAFGWDDAWMIAALVSPSSLYLSVVILTIQLSYILFAGCAIGGIQWGTGRHMKDLDQHEIFMAMRASTSCVDIPSSH